MLMTNSFKNVSIIRILTEIYYMLILIMALLQTDYSKKQNENMMFMSAKPVHT